MVAEAYLGIISRRGLERFVPETSHAARFLIRRAYRRQPPEAVCCWVVLNVEHARTVTALLAQGSRHLALETMHAGSLDFGTILPPIDDDSVQIAI